MKQKCYPLIYVGQPTLLFKFPGTSKGRLLSEYTGQNTVIHRAHIRFLQFPPLHRQNVHQHFLLFCWAHVLPYQGHLGQHESATKCSAEHASTGKLCSFCRLQNSCLLDGQTIWIFTTTNVSNLIITFLLYLLFWVIPCHLSFMCWGITQKKEYNTENMVKVWNQELHFLLT